MKDDVIFAEIGFDCKKELTVVGWAGHEVAAGGAGSDAADAGAVIARRRIVAQGHPHSARTDASGADVDAAGTDADAARTDADAARTDADAARPDADAAGADAAGAAHRRHAHRLLGQVNVNS